MQEVTQQIAQWLLDEEIPPFDQHSHAAWALVTDYGKIEKWNQDVRAEQMEWVQGTLGWPDDEWIIGRDGFGNDYVVSKSGKYTGVHMYDHEAMQFEPCQPSLRAFFDHCLRLERPVGRVTREEITQFVKDRLGFTPTPQTRFWRDTGTAGLDAWAFMQEFADHYGVEPGKIDDGIDYGDGEDGLGGAFAWLWKKLTFQPVPKTGHFTIDHLVEAANRKKWFDP
ncbi:MAG: hypothetical protein KF797_03475 [Flavobacteriales bacterium]|nr:hypothetical protein [Flavobacteriales bacterium]